MEFTPTEHFIIQHWPPSVRDLRPLWDESHKRDLEVTSVACCKRVFDSFVREIDHIPEWDCREIKRQDYMIYGVLLIIDPEISQSKVRVTSCLTKSGASLIMYLSFEP